MTATECIATLRQFNSWRRGGDKEMLDVKEIGLAIDTAIWLIEQRDELLAALVLTEGIAQRVIAATGFDESQVSDWRPVVRSAIASAKGGA